MPIGSVEIQGKAFSAIEYEKTLVHIMASQYELEIHEKNNKYTF